MPGSNPLAEGFLWQGLQRRATPHPSELKVMKKVIEVRRNEVNAARADANPSSPNSDVSVVPGEGKTERARGHGMVWVGRNLLTEFHLHARDMEDMWKWGGRKD